jgi:hypothetical protein
MPSYAADAPAIVINAPELGRQSESDIGSQISILENALSRSP